MNKEKAKEAIQLLREAFFGTEQKFKEAKLKDGVTIIKYDGDMPAVGMPVMTITEQGELPLPDGEYEMEDGAMMVIVNGVVSEIKPAEAAPADPNATPTPNEMNDKPITGTQAKAIIESSIKETRFADQIKDLTEKFSTLAEVKENFSKQKEASESELKELKAAVEKQKETITALFALVEKISGEPSEPPAGEEKKPFNVAEFRKAFREDLAKHSKK